MFVRRFSVENFMIHRATDIRLAPITAFVGPNNSGKSSVFDALLSFSRVASDPISEAFSPGPYSYRSRHHHGCGDEETMSFDVEVLDSPDADTAIRYQLSFRQTGFVDRVASYEIADERIIAEPTGDVLFDRADSPVPEDIADLVTPEVSLLAALRSSSFRRGFVSADPRLARLARSVSRMGKYRLNPALMSRASEIPEILTADVGARPPLPRMRYEGEGLASVLYFLSRTRSPQLDEIVAGVTSAIDGFEGFEFNSVPSGLVGFSARFSDSRDVVEAPNLSSGTLSLIGWLTLLLRGDRQPILMIEEPELGLTPRSTEAVYAAIRQAAHGGIAAERSQILIASHSPYLLSGVAKDEGFGAVYRLTPVAGEARSLTYDEALDEGGIGQSFDRAMAVEVANQVMHRF